MKSIKLKYLMSTVIALLSGQVFAENKIECLMQVIVISSSKFAEPKTQYTQIKNDSSPMLLIGIKIQKAKAAFKSVKIQSHQKYCSSLVGQRKDAYLSGRYESNNIQIKLGDQLELKNIHRSGKHYPFWVDFYFPIKAE
ncbi:hypothetical protein [Acinetobacter sp. YH01020]|uniref:hypothetical protein n=1 Tax=Acinetobacter sp. YH01020 TaxID=2601034 RepID=UPI0015D2C56E